MHYLDFLENDLGKILRHILCIIYTLKCFSRYILLTDQISVHYCRYFLRY